MERYDLRGGRSEGKNPELGAEIEYRTRYARYIGECVLHRHILPHEDIGMMQNVEIVLAGTEPVRPCAKYDALDQDRLCATPSGG
jgi:hypothetical protein